MDSGLLAKLRGDLEFDEGVKYEIYNDHLGYPTFGIGHLIKNGDPEKGQPVGTAVSKERVQSAFEKDIKVTLADCDKLFPDFNSLPDEAKLVLANMMFNLGYTKLSGFRNFRAAIEKRDWRRASEEMKNSLWYRQVTKRAQRLTDRILSLVN